MAEDDRPRTLEEIKLDAVLKALARRKGNKSQAADDLGVCLRTVYNLLDRGKKLGRVSQEWLDSMADRFEFYAAEGVLDDRGY